MARTTSADSQISNEVLVFASLSGRYYARSEPYDYEGSRGKTEVYRVGKVEDKEIFQFDWYTRRLGFFGMSFVRWGGVWPSEIEGREKWIVLSFYSRDRLLAEYSALDIAGSEENISRSVSNSWAFTQALGFRSLGHSTRVFELCSNDRRVMAFDIKTGQLFSNELDEDGDKCASET